MVGRRGVLAILVTLALGYLCYVRVPPDMDVPLSGRVKLAVIKTIRMVGSVMTFTKLGSPISVCRWSIELFGPGNPSDSVITIGNTYFDGIPVRLYTPNHMKAKIAPGIVYLHGGGWTFYFKDMYDEFLRKLAVDTGTVIAAVDYRLAPEHKFPAGFDDCRKAVSFFLRNAVKFGVDPTRIAIAGDSAGGNLAAAVSLALRDSSAKIPELKLQVLITPALQVFDLKTPSIQQNDVLGGYYVLNQQDMAYYYLNYILGHDYTKNDVKLMMDNKHITSKLKRSKFASHVDHKAIPKALYKDWYVPNKPDSGSAELENKIKAIITNQYFAPLMAEELHGLPETFISVSEYDVLRDDSIWYAKRLRGAGVKVTQDFNLDFHIAPVYSLKSKNEAYTKLKDFIKKNL